MYARARLNDSGGSREFDGLLLYFRLEETYSTSVVQRTELGPLPMKIYLNNEDNEDDSTELVPTFFTLAHLDGANANVNERKVHDTMQASPTQLTNTNCLHNAKIFTMRNLAGSNVFTGSVPTRVLLGTNQPLRDKPWVPSQYQKQPWGLHVYFKERLIERSYVTPKIKIGRKVSDVLLFTASCIRASNIPFRKLILAGYLFGLSRQCRIMRD